MGDGIHGDNEDHSGNPSLSRCSRAAGAALAGLVILTAAARGELPSAISVVEMGAGRLFVDAAGFTLYTYKRDGEQPGASVCVDGCAKTWPPLTADEDATPVGDWSVIQRPDGSRQWAHKNTPVYRYIRDTHPGAMAGEKASGFWDLLFEPAPTPPGINIHGVDRGQILVDGVGRFVYTNSAVNCDSTCMQDWLPVEAPWLARSLNDEWTLRRSGTGLLQWAFRDQPLFVPTVTNDAQVSRENGWELVIVQPAPPLPDWVTFQEADFGPVLADENRMTLYSMASDPEKVRKETCNDQCREDNWEPVIAPTGTEPIGNWSTLPLGDGREQWAYLGLGVYRFKHDKIPGDILGDKFATGAAIRDGWRAILKESLAQKLF